MIPDPLACWSKTGRSRGRSNEMCVQLGTFPWWQVTGAHQPTPQQSILFAAVWTLAKHTSQTESRLPSPNDRVNLARPSKEGPSLSLSFSSMCTARSVRLTLCVKSNSRVVRRVIRNLRNLRVRRCRGCGSGRCSSSSRSLSTRIIVIIPHHCQRFGPGWLMLDEHTANPPAALIPHPDCAIRIAFLISVTRHSTSIPTSPIRLSWIVLDDPVGWAPLTAVRFPYYVNTAKTSYWFLRKPAATPLASGQRLQILFFVYNDNLKEQGK